MKEKTNEQKNEIEKTQPTEIQIREIRGPKPRRPHGPRLSSKQNAFFKDVFGYGIPLTNAMEGLHIRKRTFMRWLRNPLFAAELQMNLETFDIEARIEVARSIPVAVSELAWVNKETTNVEAVRKAGNDLLKLGRLYNRSPHSGMALRISARTHQFGLMLEQVGRQLTPELQNSALLRLSNITEKTLNPAQNPAFCPPAQHEDTLPQPAQPETAHPTPLPALDGIHSENQNSEL